MNNEKIKSIISLLSALLVYGLIVMFIVLSFPGRNNFQLWKLFEHSDLLLKGWFITIGVSIVSLVLSSILGFLLYLMVKSRSKFVQYLGHIFNEIVFGSPLIVFLIVVYYFISVPFQSYFNIPRESFFVSPLFMGTITLSLFMAPYMKNVFEGAMKSIDDLQYQAMTVFGFTKKQQYQYIIIPQLLKIIIPPMIGNLTFIVKGSALLNFISVPEIYNSVTTVQSRELAVVEGYLAMFVLYLLITIPLIRITKYFEKKVASWN